MARAYEYLMASLPVLVFGNRAPFGFQRFLDLCQDQIPDEDLALVIRTQDPRLYERRTGQPTIDGWADFEATLRNELVKIRASRKKLDAETFVRREGISDPVLVPLALHAHRIPALLESERFLDSERWKRLDELCCGHYFDVDALLVYALKLAILLRWDLIEKADKERLLEEALRTVS